MLQMFDALTLARFQFAFTVSFHFIFPAFTIGLASYLAVLEALWLWRRNQVYLDLFNFWKKSSPSHLAWEWFRASSCHTSSARTGACFQTRQAPSLVP